MSNLIDILLPTLGIPLLLTVGIAGLLRLKKLSLTSNLLTFAGVLVSLVCVWFWMEKGLDLKYDDGIRVERKEGKYAMYSDAQIQERLTEIKEENEETRKSMTLYGLGYFFALGTALIINLKGKTKPSG